MIQHLYLVRHGQTDFNVEKRIQGQGADSNLTATGIKQAQMLAERLQENGVSFDFIFTSPLARAVHTARIATAHLGQELILEELVKEIYCGDFEGKLFAELDQTILTRVANHPTEKYPGGESSVDVRNRGLAFLEKISHLDGTTAIVFSHGNFLRNFAGAATGLPPEMFMRVTKDNAAISYLARHGDFFRIVTWNDTAHMYTLPPLK